MKKKVFCEENYLDLTNKEMLEINGGGRVWRHFGKMCKDFAEFWIGLAEASADGYHMGMM